jgi:L-ascorbate metabolism protein UlaG (beta-lactamase superfamily)
MSGMELFFLGQSGFRLRDPDGGPVVFIDPFLSPHEGRTWQAPVGLEALARADFVLCTHEHIDHFDQPALKAANEEQSASFKLVVPEPIASKARDLGIPADRVVGVQPGRTFEWPGLKVTPVPARHGVNVSDAYNFGEKLSGGEIRYLGYVVELGGVRAYHAGDTTVYDGQEGLIRPLKPQLALLPINGRGFYRETERNIVGNMGPREAAHLAVDIGAQVLVPMHWDMFSFNRGYPRDVVAYVDQNLPHLTVLVFGRAAKFTYRPDGES